MKNTLFAIGVAVLSAVVLSSFVWSGDDDHVQKPKKSHHVRMVKIENGKKMQIDTVFTNDDVFVWNGDTINPLKQDGDKKYAVVRSFGKGDGNANVMVFKHRKGEPMFFGVGTGDDMEVITDDNDSTGKKIVVREIRKGRPADHMIYRYGPGMKHFPPVPPVPPVQQIMKFKHSGKVIDLNDPNVISYKKKDLSGGREKIEIIRKKGGENEAAAFDFKFDNDDFMAPEPPEAPEMPEFGFHSERDSLDMKIIEKDEVTNGKEDKKIDVKVEPEKNK